jgi:dTDP-4-dehydrorhamnose reductase
MRALVTGASGTVGKELRRHLQECGDEVIAWDRHTVPIDQYQRMEDFVRETRPDALFHLAVASRSTGRENEGWLVGHHWTSELAWITRRLGVRFVYTSTVMVYTDAARGPFTPSSPPDATEGYGGDKRRSEERVFQQNPEAVVARLGWQIGETAGSNNMVDFLENTMREQGIIGCSTRWLPSCSFLADTAAALRRAASAPPGLYLLNANERWNFFEIATALNKVHGGRWRLRAHEDFVQDQRMQDDRLGIDSLKTRLPTLQ